MSNVTHLAHLRHAYGQLARGAVRDQPRFAEGLIAPAIRAIETDVEPHRPDITVLFSVAYIDGIMEDEPDEIVRHWQRIKSFVEGLAA